MHIVWFKKDLRITDHQAIYEAMQSQQKIIFLYVFEPEILSHPSFHASHWEFLTQSLIELRSSLMDLGADLSVCIGEATEVLHQIYKTHPFSVIHAHEETGHNASFQRDMRVIDWCNKYNVSFIEHHQTGVIRRLRSRDGWSRKWAGRMKKDLIQSEILDLKQAHPKDLPEILSFKIPDKKLFAIPGSKRPNQQSGGRSHGLTTLHSFLEQRGMGYQKEMSSPVSAWTGCSRMSPYLSFGCVSMREVHKATTLQQERWRAETLLAEEKKKWLASLRSFSGRLRWHCHFMQKLEDEPRIERESMVRAYDALRTDPDPSYEKAWREGMTGYPMVDACMRALHASGWINFRMRAMLVSFATYDLWLPWQNAAKILAPLFLDYEPGIHYSQVQMQAGATGINTLRIYSPTKQIKDHDPEGVFIRKYVPELTNLPSEFIAEPWKAPDDVQKKAKCQIGQDYPIPIVDHGVAVKLARSKVMKVRRQAETKKEAQDMLNRHGSRKSPRDRKSKSNK